VVYLTEVLSTETAGTFSASLELTSETIITLDVKLKSGTHNNSRVTLEHSPDGSIWFTSNQSTNGTGSITDQVSTRFVRACVLRGEGSAAEAYIFITAK
jgi:hypothetical protein